jgi:hypothetical protein
MRQSGQEFILAFVGGVQRVHRLLELLATFGERNLLFVMPGLVAQHLEEPAMPAFPLDGGGGAVSEERLAVLANEPSVISADLTSYFAALSQPS